MLAEQSVLRSRAIAFRDNRGYDPCYRSRDHGYAPLSAIRDLAKQSNNLIKTRCSSSTGAKARAIVAVDYCTSLSKTTYARPNLNQTSVLTRPPVCTVTRHAV
jgi:hypothetical protein